MAEQVPIEVPIEGLVRRKNIHTIMYKEILANLKNMTAKGCEHQDLYSLYMKNYEEQYDWWEIASYMWRVNHSYEAIAIAFNIDVEIVTHMMN
jgi:hypothetical protein